MINELIKRHNLSQKWKKEIDQHQETRNKRILCPNCYNGVLTQDRAGVYFCVMCRKESEVKK
jgi:ribosomal protein L37AE/L43A